MTTDYILTSFQPYEDGYDCPCGAEIDTYEDWDEFHWFSQWSYCPQCGERRVDYITEEQALGLIAFWAADIDWEAYKIDGEFDYYLLWEDFPSVGESKNKQIVFKSLHTFRCMIDKAYEIDAKGGVR